MSETYSNFTLTRHLEAPRERVWSAFCDPTEYAAWFGAPSEQVTTKRAEHDIRIGGTIDLTSAFHGGPSTRFLARITDIVESERLAYTYDMWLDAAHMSTSLAVITLDDAAGGSNLTWVEMGVHFDDLDTPDQREAGTVGLIDQLAAYVRGDRRG